MAENDPVSKRCGECDREITIGRDAIRIQEGVIGTKDFIELSDELLFCNEVCLSHLVIDHDREKRKLHEHTKAGVNVALERARLTVSEYEQERRMFRKDIVAIQADLAELRQVVAQLSPLSPTPTHAIPSAQAYQANE